MPKTYRILVEREFDTLRDAINYTEKLCRSSSSSVSYTFARVLGEDDRVVTPGSGELYTDAAVRERIAQVRTEIKRALFDALSEAGL